MRLSANRDILVVEDDPDDIFLYRQALADTIDTDRLTILRNGDDVIDWGNRLLSDQGDPSVELLPELPGLILMDIKMPRTSGLEVLRWLRDQKILRRIPIVIVSSSQAHSDINLAYDLGANAYLVKPLMFREMKEKLDHLCRFWLDIVTPPTYHVHSQ